MAAATATEESDEVWENESRMFVSKPWGSPSSIARFTDLFGKKSTSPASLSPSPPQHQQQQQISSNAAISLAPTVPVPLGFIVTRDWAVDKFGFESGLCDEMGWSYGMHFKQLQAAYAQSECSGDPRERQWMVRRRRWELLSFRSSSTNAQAASGPLKNLRSPIKEQLSSAVLSATTAKMFTPDTVATPSARKYSASPRKKKVLNERDSSDEDDDTNDGFEDVHEEEEEDEEEEEEADEDEFAHTSAAAASEGSSTFPPAGSTSQQRPVFFYIKNAQLIQPHQIGTLTRKQVKIIKMGRNCTIEDLKHPEKGARSGFFVLRVWNPMILSKTKYLLNAHTVQIKEAWVKGFSDAIALASTSTGVQNSSSTSAALPAPAPPTISSRLHLPNLRLSSGMMTGRTSTGSISSPANSSRPNISIAEQAATAARKRIGLGSWGASISTNKNQMSSLAGSITKKRSSGTPGSQLPVVIESATTKGSKEVAVEPTVPSPSHRRSHSEEESNSEPLVEGGGGGSKRRTSGWSNLIPSLTGSPGTIRDKKEPVRRHKHSHSITSEDSDYDHHGSGEARGMNGSSSKSFLGLDTEGTASVIQKVKLIQTLHGIGIEVHHLTLKVCSVFTGEKGPVYAAEGSDTKLLPNDIIVAINGAPISSITGLKTELGKVLEGGEIIVTLSRNKSSNESSPKVLRPRSRSSSSNSSMKRSLPNAQNETSSSPGKTNNRNENGSDVHGGAEASENTLKPIAEGQDVRQSQLGRRKPLQEPPNNSAERGITKELLRTTIQNHLRESFSKDSGEQQPYVTFTSLKQSTIKSVFSDPQALKLDKEWNCYFRDLIDEIVAESGEYKVGGLSQVGATTSSLTAGYGFTPTIFRMKPGSPS